MKLHTTAAGPGPDGRPVSRVLPGPRAAVASRCRFDAFRRLDALFRLGLLCLPGLLGPVAGQAAPKVEPRPTAPDRIVLKSGEVLLGRIDARDAATVTITIQGGKQRPGVQGTGQPRTGKPRAGKPQPGKPRTVKLPRTRIRAVQPHGKDVGIFGIAPPAPPATPAQNAQHAPPAQHAQHAPPAQHAQSAPEAAVPPATYIRFEPGKRKAGVAGTLSTGVSRWYHAASDTTLFLVGAVHIAEQPYYDRIQVILDQTDVVLFETVRKAESELTDEQLASLTALGKMQLAMKDALGLRFQKTAMDYDRPFWKNADVDFATLQKHMEDNEVTLPTDNPFVRGLLGVVTSLISRAKKDERAHDILRRQLAPVLAQADKILATKMQKLGSSIIIFRNAKAMEIVQKEIAAGPKGRWLSLFYGAGHLPDLTKRLVKYGFVFQGSDWVTAWHFTGR